MCGIVAAFHARAFTTHWYLPFNFQNGHYKDASTSLSERENSPVNLICFERSMPKNIRATKLSVPLQTGPLPVSPWRWACVWGTLSWRSRCQRTDSCWQQWWSRCCCPWTPGGWWCLPPHSGGPRLNHWLQGLDRRCWVLMWKHTCTHTYSSCLCHQPPQHPRQGGLSYRGVRWTGQTLVASWSGVKAPGSRHRGGRFSHRWSWRWSRPPRWTERSGGRRRPGSGPRGGLWVHRPESDGTPRGSEHVSWVCYCGCHQIIRRRIFFFFRCHWTKVLDVRFVDKKDSILSNYGKGLGPGLTSFSNFSEKKKRIWEQK